ncbi:MAG: DUF4194 domain-containing protein [Candidatus Methanoperedens sp.]|nr:DUF4194 domain-containing protein [Candidatus Methanoperedens sp.]CAG0989740.1 hypothetical protein METP1_02233 [Methanosarcinales archaeon]
METDKILKYAPAVIKLLQGAVYYDDKDIWENLLSNSTSIEEYFEKIGIRVIINESDGYAFIEQKRFEEENNINLPRLTRKIPLSYDVTLLCVLLREKLLQYDTGSSYSLRPIISKEDIYEMLSQFFKERTDEKKQRRKFDTIINKVIELGFLRPLENSGKEEYEIRAILKARIKAETLNEIKQMLQRHAEDIRAEKSI